MGHFNKTCAFQLENPFYFSAKNVQTPMTVVLSHLLGHITDIFFPDVIQVSEVISGVIRTRFLAASEQKTDSCV